MKRILFVDDEPNILAGLRALLRPHRAQWDMVFATGGAEAIAELGGSRFDVVVTDMKMPGVDGAAVLRHAQQNHPEVVRIVLSGHAELESALRTVPVAHQFLLKPCDPGSLENAVDRACELQALVNDPAVRALVGGLHSLPPLPSTYAELTQRLEDERSTMSEIARLVEGDAGMCAKLLQLVNSAFIGLGREITSVDEAIGYVGINLLKNLTLVVHVFEEDGAGRTQGLWLYRQQRHGLLVGAIARKVAGRDRRMADDCFMAGILHDVGKLVMMRIRPDAFIDCQDRARDEQRPLHVLERERLGVTHAEVGGYLLGIWGLPYPIVEAVADHHAPGRVPSRQLDVLTAVHVADWLAHEQEGTLGVNDAPPSPLDEEYLERVGVLGSVPEWREYAATQLGAERAGAWREGARDQAA